jgi:ferredoxin
LRAKSWFVFSLAGARLGLAHSGCESIIEYKHMSFTVKVEPSGRTFSANEGETLLAAAIRQGIGLPYGCKDGACGSCKCKKIEGVVVHGSHQDKALSAQEEENGLADQERDKIKVEDKADIDLIKLQY